MEQMTRAVTLAELVKFFYVGAIVAAVIWF
jgi:hypothetical protein